MSENIFSKTIQEKHFRKSAHEVPASSPRHLVAPYRYVPRPASSALPIPVAALFLTMAACPSDDVAEGSTTDATATGTAGETETIPKTSDGCEIVPLDPTENLEQWGEWSEPVDWSESALSTLITCEVPPCDTGPGFLAVHAVHLPTGKVLFWDGVENQYLWTIETGSFQYVPAIYPRNGCAFDGLVDCTTSTDCEEYCTIVGGSNPKCTPQPDFGCVMNACTLDGSISCLDSDDCVEYCAATGAATIECNPPPDFTCESTDEPAELFCAGHALGADGRVTLAGGNVTGSPAAFGKREMARFTTTEEWERVPDVQLSTFRWYPSAIPLGDGRIFILGGAAQNVAEIFDPEAPPEDAVDSTMIYPADFLSDLNEELFYPFIFQIELGLVFAAGGEGLSGMAYWSGYLFDTLFSNFWVTNFEANSTTPGGSAVMFQNGKIMKSGGCKSFSNRCQANDVTEVIDLTSLQNPLPNESDESPHPQWTATCPMNHPRHFHTLTVLPDGKVLATGGNTEGNGHGSSYCGNGSGMAQCDSKDGDLDCTVGRCSNSLDFQACDMMNPCPDEVECFVAGGSCLEYDNAEFSTRTAELWDPVTKVWTELGAQANPRMYHSVAFLLPDGRVLSAGGGKRQGLIDQLNAEFSLRPTFFKVQDHHLQRRLPVLR